MKQITLDAGQVESLIYFIENGRLDFSIAELAGNQALRIGDDINFVLNQLAGDREETAQPEFFVHELPEQRDFETEPVEIKNITFENAEFNWLNEDQKPAHSIEYTGPLYLVGHKNNTCHIATVIRTDNSAYYRWAVTGTVGNNNNFKVASGSSSSLIEALGDVEYYINKCEEILDPIKVKALKDKVRYGQA